MKKVSVIMIGIVAVILGVVGGYFYRGHANQSVVLPDGDYTVSATWNWKKLTVNKNKYILDNARNYDVLAQNNKNGIVVLNTVKDSKVKNTHVYKIVKTDNHYKWHTVTNGKVSDKVIATITKK